MNKVFVDAAQGLNSKLNSEGSLNWTSHTSFVLGQPPPLFGSLSIANVMENDDNQEGETTAGWPQIKEISPILLPCYFGVTHS